VKWLLTVMLLFGLMFAMLRWVLVLAVEERCQKHGCLGTEQVAHAERLLLLEHQMRSVQIEMARGKEPNR
jgi:hypothetical protein